MNIQGTNIECLKDKKCSHLNEMRWHSPKASSHLAEETLNGTYKQDEESDG
jgi:hypothetical protein